MAFMVPNEVVNLREIVGHHLQVPAAPSGLPGRRGWAQLEYVLVYLVEDEFEFFLGLHPRVHVPLHGAEERALKVVESHWLVAGHLDTRGL
jgi:hypothetical protein